jgi:hypothetical protein
MTFKSTNYLRPATVLLLPALLLMLRCSPTRETPLCIQKAASLTVDFFCQSKGKKSGSQNLICNPLTSHSCRLISKNLENALTFYYGAVTVAFCKVTAV